MNTMNLNAELFRELSYIADDENSMKKLLAYVKKLVAKQEQNPVVSEEAIHTLPPPDPRGTDS